MFSPAHALAGIVIGKAAEERKYAVPLAFASHLFLDRLGQYHPANSVTIGLSTLVAALIGYRWRRYWPSIIAACILDLEWALPYSCPWRGWFHSHLIRGDWVAGPWWLAFEIGLVIWVLAMIETRFVRTQFGYKLYTIGYKLYTICKSKKFVI